MKAVSIQEQPTFTHPVLKAAVDDFVAGVKLSLHRALSQNADSPAARAPMPGQADSLEQLFAGYLRLPRVAGAPRAAAARTAPPPTPAGVNPTDPTPVLDQLVRYRKANNFGFTPASAQDLVRDRSLIAYRGGRFDFGNQEDGGQDPTSRKLIQLRIHAVKCLKETSEWGDDEIALGGLVVDDVGAIVRVPEFYVSKSFNTGETKAFNPPRPFANFTATKNGQKKMLLAILALAEKDHGGFANFLNEVWSRVTLQATIFAGAFYVVLSQLIPAFIQGFAIVASVLSGLLIGALVGAALTAIFIALASLLQDDIFKPVTAALYVPTIDEPFATPPEVASYSGHGGSYQVTYDWAVIV
jgi:hypothetical protein